MYKSLFSFWILLVSNGFLFSQSKEVLIEYEAFYDVEFITYADGLDTIRKVDYYDESLLNTPRGWVQSYFSANDSIWDSKLVGESSSFVSRGEEHYDRVRKMNQRDNYALLLDSYEFLYSNEKVCIVFFLMYFDGVDFNFPSTWTLTQRNGVWLEYDPTINQHTLDDVLFTGLKPCTMEMMLGGQDEVIAGYEDLYARVRGRQGYLSIKKLFEKSQEWEEAELKLYTIYEERSCGDRPITQDTVISKVDYIDFLRGVTVVKHNDRYPESRDSLADVLKEIIESEDSVLVTMSLLLESDLSSYHVVKYRVWDGDQMSEEKNQLMMGERAGMSSSLTKVYDYYLGLNSEAFDYLLYPRNMINEKYKEVYERTRGTHYYLNIDRLNELLKESPQLFEGMLSN